METDMTSSSLEHITNTSVEVTTNMVLNPTTELALNVTTELALNVTTDMALNVTTDMALNVTMSFMDVDTTSTEVYGGTTMFPDTEIAGMYVDYMYPGFSFERPMYLYIWTILVILTSIVNMIVISILLRRKMRNPTNIVLAAIAISDSLTSLTTLTTYIMVYLSTEPSDYYDQTLSSSSSSENDMASYAGHVMYPEAYLNNSIGAPHTGMVDNHSENEPYGGYYLSKDLCRWFMATKFFISKTFHSISIYLTLFLAIQRFISIAVPFKAHALTNQRALLICIVIALLSPLLHVFHLTDEKAALGMCEWNLADRGCAGGCIQLWIMFVIRNFIPCGALLVFTVLFIRELHKGEESIRRMESSRDQIVRRVVENRRIAVIVTSIVIVFLIPEIPYGFYLLYNAIDKTVYNGVNMDLETNRAIHMSYEILLVISFHANFYIYTLFNRKFRKFLIKLFVQPVRRMVGDKRRMTVSSIGGSLKTSQRKTEQMSLKSNRNNTLKTTPSNTLSKPPVETTAFMNSVSADITQTSNNDNGELEVLNANV